MNNFIRKNFKNKKIGFIGIGVSHIDTIKYFLKNGFSVNCYDKSSEEKVGVNIINDLKELGAKIFLENEYYSFFDCDIIFRTPGMYFLNDDLKKLKEKGKYITSEIEMFLTLCPCTTIGVTGSDGKTTTSTIISEMLKEEGFNTHLGGNIGKALLPIIDDIKEDDFCVIELSSFQLISMTQKVDISVITNIEENHLDVHKDMSEYISAKKNVFLHQHAISKTVLNYKNKITNSFKDEVRGRTLFFNNDDKLKTGAFIDDDNIICYKDFNETKKLFSKNEIRLVGEHNVENYLCAITAVYDFVSVKTMLKVAKNFNGVQHRMEFVRTVNGVSFFNDSIASSPTRTIAGLGGFTKKINLIAGGYNKNLDYTPLCEPILKSVKNLILLGDTTEKIYNALKNSKNFNRSNINIYKVNNMNDAVTTGLKVSNDGDIVALSPASASFDMYKNFEVRGNDFKNIVNKL